MLATTDEDRLLLIPGPTPVARTILEALSKPTVSHNSHEFAELFSAALDRLRAIAGNSRGQVFVFSGSGTLAQEAAILNFVDPGDRLLVASNGFFADRLTEIARCHGLDATTIQAPWGASASSEELRRAIRDAKANVVAFTHIETSTGVMAPLADFTSVIRDEGALSIVDGVAALGGVPEEMETLGIDILLSGAQKALGVPPGLAIVAASEAAWRKREARTHPVRAFYADLTRWLPVMEHPEKYFSTHPVNLIYALAMGLEIVADEGMESRYRRHQTLAAVFRSGMGQLGFEPFTNSQWLAPTLSVLRTPKGLSSSGFRERLRQAGVVAAGGIGDQEDRIARFGHMGNISMAEVAIALRAAGDSIG